MTKTITTGDLLKIAPGFDEEPVQVIVDWTYEGPQEANGFKGSWDCTSIQVFTADGKTRLEPPESEIRRLLRNAPKPEAPG